jgi:hypothetical protein
MGQPGGQRVCLEVVDGDKGQIPRGGDRLGRHHTHDQATDQPWAGGGGNAIEILPPRPGMAHRTADQGIEMVEMRACRDLRHHAAIRAVRLGLAQNLVGADCARIVHQRRRRFVATGFYPQDQHALIYRPCSGSLKPDAAPFSLFENVRGYAIVSIMVEM